jgi:hypothetical protein
VTSTDPDEVNVHGTARGKAQDRLFRWLGGTTIFAQAAIYLGIVVQFIGAGLVIAGQDSHVLLFLVGGTILSLGLTISAKARNRTWAWGLLGFANFFGAILVLNLKVRCPRCGVEIPREVLLCQDCRISPPSSEREP